MLKKTCIALVAAAALGAIPAAAQDRPRAAAEVEVTLPVPRGADGAIDVRAIDAEVRRQLAAGATEMRFRGDFTQEEARRLLLDARVLGQLGALLPNDGVERDVRLRGAVEARVQRTEEGGLRARIEQIDVGNLGPEQRADLARRLAAQSGFERVRIRGTDASGERVRVEFRDGRGIVRNEGRGDARVARSDNSGPGSGADRPRREDRAQRAERAERAERVERPERGERVERPERSGGGSGRR